MVSNTRNKLHQTTCKPERGPQYSIYYGTRGAKTKVVSIPRHRPILIELSPVLKYRFVISIDLNQLTLQLTRLSPESVCVGVVSLGQQTVSLLGPLHKGIADAVLQEQRDKNWHFIERAR